MKNSTMGTYSFELEQCSREPIHLAGKIQPHGILLSVSTADWRIVHLSENCSSWLEKRPEELIGESLSALFDANLLDEIKEQVRRKSLAQLNPKKVKLPSSGNWVDAVFSRVGELLVIELEKSSSHTGDPSFASIYRTISSSLEEIEAADSLHEVCERTVRAAKNLSGFHRVMIYQFDSHWNGKVISEAKGPHLEPFLHLHYPASDIPTQARELYLRNWIRLIPDVYYAPVPLVGESNEPLDLTHSILRSVSPVHIQYLKNMGVGASMSVSVIKEGRLWGLIAFHHQSACYLPYEVRQGLEFLGKYFSLQISAKEKFENREYRNHLAGLHAKLFDAMRERPDFLSGLSIDDSTHFLRLAQGVGGGAICYRNDISLFGQTPTLDQVAVLRDWLRVRVGVTPVFFTANLSSELASAEEYKNVASGILCLSIPEPLPGYVVWFKPEVIQTIDWGGNPEKPVSETPSGTLLSPRHSFALWKEVVKNHSLPWEPQEVEVAEQLRRSIIEVDLERQVALALDSNAELTQFAQLVAHDLQEPLRGISAFSEFIQKDETHLSHDSLENLKSIHQLAERGRKMISSLYEYSKLGKVHLAIGEIDLNVVLKEVLERLSGYLTSLDVTVCVPALLPTVVCDRIRIGEVFANLISNAAKYNDRSKKLVEIGFITDGNGQKRFYVRDNGIGIARQDHQRVFGMFDRLHEQHEYGGGMGVGLALVRRIIERHHGKIWVESHPKEGATFCFTLGTP